MDPRKPNWNELWQKLRDTYRIADKPRNAAVLENFKDSKEAICRKMGVVSGTDIVRIASKFKPKEG